MALDMLIRHCYKIIINYNHEIKISVDVLTDCFVSILSKPDTGLQIRLQTTTIITISDLRLTSVRHTIINNEPHIIKINNYLLICE